MCITIGVCDTCYQPVYWLIDSQKWHHFDTRNIPCTVIVSDLLVGVAPESAPTNTDSQERLTPLGAPDNASFHN